MNKAVAIIDFVGIKGGNHYYSLCLLDALAELGFKTYLFSNFNQGLNEENISINRCYPDNISRSTKGIFDLLSGTLKACRLAKRKGVKTVIFHLFEASWISLMVLTLFKLFGFQVIGISHDVTSFGKDENQGVRNFIYSRLLQHVIVHNQYSYDFLERVLPSKIIAKTHIVKHGGHQSVIDSSISKKYARDELRLDQTKTYALFFGQIKKVKGLDLLLEAFPKENSELNLIIAGKPWRADFKSYQAIIDQRELNDRIDLHIEYISEKKRDLLYNAADFIILPYREIFQSGVLLMAMSYGLPILASDLPANKEVISGEEGQLFKTENREDLESKIRRMATNSELRLQYAEMAKHKIDREYAWNTIALDYVPLIK